MKIEPTLTACSADAVRVGTLFLVPDRGVTYLALRIAAEGWHHLALTGEQAFTVTTAPRSHVFQLSDAPIFRLELDSPLPNQQPRIGAARLEKDGQCSLVAGAVEPARRGTDPVAVSLDGARFTDELGVAPQYGRWQIGVPSLGEILWLLKHDCGEAPPAR